MLLDPFTPSNVKIAASGILGFEMFIVKGVVDGVSMVGGTFPSLILLTVLVDVFPSTSVITKLNVKLFSANTVS